MWLLIRNFLVGLPNMFKLILAAIGLTIASYQLGHHMGKSEEKQAQAYQALTVKYQQQTEVSVFQGQVDIQNKNLTQAFQTLSDQREVKHESVRSHADELVAQYGTHQLQFPQPDPITGTYSGIRAPAETIVVELPDAWGFSSKDRETLIREAARADQIAAELNQCKAAVDLIYEQHSLYKSTLRKYEERIQKID